MFNQLFSVMKLMGNAGKVQQEMAAFQERSAQLTAEGDAGAGMVRVKVNGRMLVVNVTLSDEAMQGGDRELVEDLIAAATNQAIDNVRILVAEEMAKMTAALGLPAGMNLPLPGL